jgi:hypothetical protein
MRPSRAYTTRPGSTEEFRRVSPTLDLSSRAGRFESRAVPFPVPYENFVEVVENAPAPSPWPELWRPVVVRRRRALRWQRASMDLFGAEYDVNSMVLTDEHGALRPEVDILAWIHYGTYVDKLDDETLLAWFREDNAFRMLAIPIESLAPLPHCKPRAQDGVAFTGSSLFSILIPSNLRAGSHSFAFPEALNPKGELLLIASEPDLRFFALSPRHGTIDVMPQAWFESRRVHDDDIGSYKWVARIARDPDTECIFGQSVRMPNFVLDPTGTTLLHEFV